MVLTEAAKDKDAPESGRGAPGARGPPWSCRESLQTPRALVSPRDTQSLPWCEAPVLRAQPHQAASPKGDQTLITPRASSLNILNVWFADQLGR